MFRRQEIRGLTEFSGYLKSERKKMEDFNIKTLMVLIFALTMFACLESQAYPGSEAKSEIHGLALSVGMSNSDNIFSSRAFFVSR